MKKKIVIILIGLLSLIGIQSASAVTVQYTGTRENILKSSGGYYSMKIYRANLDGESLMTYCLDAGRTYAGDGDYYIEHVIDPSRSEGTSWYTYDVAVTYAYQYMQQNGYASTTIDNNVIGELVFRWITEAFNSAGCGPTCGPTLGPAYTLFRKLTTGFSASDPRVAVAIDIYNKATTVALQNLSYEQLIANGFDSDNPNGIWGAQWETKTYTNSPLSADQYQLYIEITPANGTSLDRIDYSNFKVTFTNPTIANNIVSQSSAKASDGVVSLTVTFNKGAWDGNDPGVVVEGSYCSPMNASSQLYFLKRKNGYQRMLVVLPGKCSSIPGKYDNPSGGGGGTHIRQEHSCMCNTTTGVYTYTDKNGNKTTWSGKEQRPSNVPSTVSCPNTCDKKTTCNQVGDKYYCKDGNECNQDKYEQECTHKCEQSSESSTGYFCETDDGKGRECSATEYKYLCENDGVNCSPTISLPSSCNNISDNIESTTNGTVSDINEISTSCNPDVNQIKKCVLGSQDLTGASFEATNELSNNPYCKVWCKEKYDFELPTAKITTSGGYFTLETTVTGERDCYISSADDSSKGIDSAKFQSDLINAQHAVIDAFNAYSVWHYAVKTYPRNETYHNDTHTASSCDCCGGYDDEGDCEGDSCEEDSTTDSYYTYSWNYIRYNYNYGSTNESASHQSGTPGYCPSSCCGGSCVDGERGTHQIDYFKNKESETKKVLIEKITALNNIISLYNSCTGAIANGTKTNISGVATADSTTNSSWANDMIFEPQVDFWYNQDYMNQMNGTFEEDSSESEKTKNTFCSGNVDDQYKCQSGSSGTLQTKVQEIFTCDEDNCSKKNFSISTAQWIQKTKINASTFKSGNEFSTYTQYGTVKLGWANCNGNDCLLTDLPEGSIPISLITKTGVFPFKFTFSHIGQSNTGTDTGRLIGSTSSVITEYAKLPDSIKCSVNENVSSSVDGGYVCHYLNNCSGTCEFTCDPNDPNNCTFNTCDDGECRIICENCIFDGESATYNYRTVSVNELFPNGLTDRGYNWSNLKGEITKKIIEQDGDEIYQTPQYTYTLTPSNMKSIREYNDEAGSFTNSNVPSKYAGKVDNTNAIYCETVTFNGINYNVNCRSSFLDLIDESGKKFATDVTRVTKEEDAFELFTDTSYCQNGSCLTNGIGPAWRLKGSSNQ